MLRISMSKFECEACQKIFESRGIKEERTSSIYGPCWKRVASCPDCGVECDEFRQKSSSKKKNLDFDSYVSGLRNQGRGCIPGGRCCG